VWFVLLGSYVLSVAYRMHKPLWLLILLSLLIIIDNYYRPKFW
jgi:hypothetical protein